MPQTKRTKSAKDLFTSPSTLSPPEHISPTIAKDRKLKEDRLKPVENRSSDPTLKKLKEELESEKKKSRELEALLSTFQDIRANNSETSTSRSRNRYAMYISKSEDEHSVTESLSPRDSFSSTSEFGDKIEIPLEKQFNLENLLDIQDANTLLKLIKYLTTSDSSLWLKIDHFFQFEALSKERSPPPKPPPRTPIQSSPLASLPPPTLPISAPTSPTILFSPEMQDSSLSRLWGDGGPRPPKPKRSQSLSSLKRHSIEIPLQKSASQDKSQQPDDDQNQEYQQSSSSSPDASPTKYYSYEVLKKKNVPAEVDLKKLEEYLSPEEFLQLFLMTREEVNLKKSCFHSPTSLSNSLGLT